MLSAMDNDRLFRYGPRDEYWKVIKIETGRVLCTEVPTGDGIYMSHETVEGRLQEFTKEVMTHSDEPY